MTSDERIELWTNGLIGDEHLTDEDVVILQERTFDEVIELELQLNPLMFAQHETLQ